MATNERFESFIDSDADWFSDIELKVRGLEDGIAEWRESRARELAESVRHRERERERDDAEADEAASGRAAAFRRADGTGGRPHREFLRATENPPGDRGSGRTSAGRTSTGQSRASAGRTSDGRTSAGRASAGRASTGRTSTGRTRREPAARHAWPIAEDESIQVADRTRVLIDRGRRTARRRRWRRGGKIVTGSAAALVVLAIGVMILARKGPSWPPSVAVMQREITTACQNPDVVSEPDQVNFACGKDTSQILWVFALMTSNGNPGYSNAKTGRKGLEPITPVQGGQIAWSLNLHHPYDPVNPVDSLEVAARAINNIVGGATLTGRGGIPAVQPGLESKPENCARYTGSPAIVSRAGFPGRCASPVTSRDGQAALAADVYQQWMAGAGPVAAQDVSVLFANAGNPGDPQVQTILKTLPNSGR